MADIPRPNPFVGVEPFAALITRTPMVDDDGSGEVGTVINNAWKQEFYNQIDAALVTAGSPVTYGAITLTDGSGAGLGSLGSGSYAKVGRVYLVWLTIIYPATANGATASIGGLPESAAMQSGFYVVYGTANLYHLSGAALVPRDPVTLTGRTNAQMSGLNVAVTGHYLAP